MLWACMYGIWCSRRTQDPIPICMLKEAPLRVQLKTQQQAKEMRPGADPFPLLLLNVLTPSLAVMHKSNQQSPREQQRKYFKAPEKTQTPLWVIFQTAFQQQKAAGSILT